jgi:hypothetical protein
MRSLSANEAMWLARGEALGLVLGLLRRAFRVSFRRLRDRLGRHLWATGSSRLRLPAE